ncbi:MAG: DUF3048 domain-containing protein [Candidatus Pacebacteria bacterium]|nr:DUF3048 domain-containing protein [Candidatus Paceibacterota bacterium]
MPKKKIIFYLLSALGLYLLSAGLSYAGFAYFGGKKGEASILVSPVSIEDGRPRINFEAPKTEICPLTGEKFTKEERAIWEKRRPLGVMIENHLDSRPQSGLSKADIVYEAVAEGGITRFLAVYFCRASAEDFFVGPVRSSRTYFLDWISEYGDYPLYVHVGGANDFGNLGKTNSKAKALEQIESYGWRLYSDIDQTSLRAKETQYPEGGLTFWRDMERLKGVAMEHTMYSTPDRLWWIAQSRGLTQTDEAGDRWDENFVPWPAKEETAQEGQVSKIEFAFWQSQSGYEVRWEYDKDKNQYLRFNNNQPHLDLNTNQQLSAKVVAIQFLKETRTGDASKHLLYQTIGQGQALVFQDGQVIKGNWRKKQREGRTSFTQENGQEIAFNPGPIWLEILPTGQEVAY